MLVLLVFTRPHSEERSAAMAGFTFIHSDERELHHRIIDAVERFSYKPSPCTLRKWTSVHGSMTVVQCIPDHLFSERVRCASGGTFFQPVTVREDGGGVSCTVEGDECAVCSIDAFNRPPVFFIQLASGAIVTTEVTPLFRAGVVPFAWDPSAVASELCWELIPPTRTLFQNVRPLRPGRVIFHGKNIRFEPNIQCDDRGQCSLDAFVQSYSNAVMDIYQSHEPVVALSGGWDSRSTLACLLGRGIKPEVMTIGTPESTDMRIAEHIASHYGLEHHRVYLNVAMSEKLPALLDESILAGNGMMSPFAIHELFVHAQMQSRTGGIIDSAGCEIRRGLKLRLLLKASRGNDASVNRFLQVYRTEFDASVFSDAVMSGCHEGFRSTQANESSSCGIVDKLFEECVWGNHYAHSYAAEVQRLESLMPMYDASLMKQYKSLPARDRWSRAIPRKVIEKEQPQLLEFPISRGGLSVHADGELRAALHVLLHRARMHTKRKLTRDGHRESASHLDYSAWMEHNRALACESVLPFLEEHGDWFVKPIDASSLPACSLLRLWKLARIEKMLEAR